LNEGIIGLWEGQFTVVYDDEIISRALVFEKAYIHRANLNIFPIH
jgi:hypothetical protein